MNRQIQPDEAATALVTGGPLLMHALRGIMLGNRAGQIR